MDTNSVTLDFGSEFEYSPFAQFYEEISDTFLKTREAAQSLMSHVATNKSIFEIGLGTGYFASFLLKQGYVVQGIQPKDELLPKLKSLYPHVQIMSECTLEDYNFDKQYDVIVSHSSVFLITRHERPFGISEEISIDYVFQSFVEQAEHVASSIAKVLNALSPDGMFFINTQANPRPSVAVGAGAEILKFEMLRCLYELDFSRVTKQFCISYKNQIVDIKKTIFCTRFTEFLRMLNQIGGKARLSDDGMWVVVEKR